MQKPYSNFRQFFEGEIPAIVDELSLRDEAQRAKQFPTIEDEIAYLQGRGASLVPKLPSAYLLRIVSMIAETDPAFRERGQAVALQMKQSGANEFTTKAGGAVLREIFESPVTAQWIHHAAHYWRAIELIRGRMRATLPPRGASYGTAVALDRRGTIFSVDSSVGTDGTQEVGLAFIVGAEAVELIETRCRIEALQLGMQPKIVGTKDVGGSSLDLQDFFQDKVEFIVTPGSPRRTSRGPVAMPPLRRAA